MPLEEGLVLAEPGVVGDDGLVLEDEGLVLELLLELEDVPWDVEDWLP